MEGGAVVGTRNASNTGERIARKISQMLASMKLSTISGLALGIDAAAHAGALEADGVTIAILAHGLDTIAPRSNRKLAEQLLERGALVSEHPPGVPPRPPEFVKRNRIQSGMALFSIVVESGEVGGSMHQARFTKDQGRPLFAVLPTNWQGGRSDFNRSGGERLVREFGATPLETAQDFELRLNQMLSRPPQLDLKFST
jgi:DNA processing protein